MAAERLCISPTPAMPTSMDENEPVDAKLPTCQRRERGANPPICQIARFVDSRFCFFLGHDFSRAEITAK
jgi:hypothetical protein